MSNQSIEELAALARLELTDDEAKELSGDLDRILAFVAELNEVNVDGVDPVASMNDLATISRPDAVGPCLDRQSVLKAAPLSNAGFIKVPKVLE